MSSKVETTSWLIFSSHGKELGFYFKCKKRSLKGRMQCVVDHELQEWNWEDTTTIPVSRYSGGRSNLKYASEMPLIFFSITI